LSDKPVKIADFDDHYLFSAGIMQWNIFFIGDDVPISIVERNIKLGILVAFISGNVIRCKYIIFS